MSNYLGEEERQGGAVASVRQPGGVPLEEDQHRSEEAFRRTPLPASDR